MTVEGVWLYLAKFVRLWTNRKQIASTPVTQVTGSRSSSAQGAYLKRTKTFGWLFDVFESDRIPDRDRLSRAQNAT